MSEFEVWIYRGAIAILLVILWYLAKDVVVELKKINKSLLTLSNQGIHHQEKIISINEKIEVHETRLNEHTGRIRECERKQDSCPYCKES